MVKSEKYTLVYVLFLASDGRQAQLVGVGQQYHRFDKMKAFLPKCLHFDILKPSYFLSKMQPGGTFVQRSF